jgi:hypothetical protein
VAQDRTHRELAGRVDSSGTPAGADAVFDHREPPTRS